MMICDHCERDFESDRPEHLCDHCRELLECAMDRALDHVRDLALTTYRGTPVDVVEDDYAERARDVALAMKGW